MNKILKKFTRDPKLFFKDLYLKRIRSVAMFQPKKHDGNHQYTVISAVYNVEKYLDDYFESLVKQRLDFTKHVYLIMVDDGSTDSSAAIIHKWQKRYPRNITYLNKENGGQASARNLGLQHVETEWVTFIDPDDFVNPGYFLEIDNFLNKYRTEQLKMVGTKLVFFHEDRKQYADNHPLNYRFAKGDAIFPHHDLQKNMQLSASTAIFLTEEIIRHSHHFDGQVKPNFEDAKFTAIYLSALTAGHVGFSGKSKYYYRKRADGSSTLDSSWSHPGLFSNVLEHGCLESLQSYQKNFGYIPKYFQRTVLYHLIWYFKKIVNRPETVFFLDTTQKKRFIDLVAEIFTYIDNQTILEFELAGCWFFHKAGMLACFKQQSPGFQIAYVEDYDAIKQQVLLRYFTREVGLEAFRLDDQDTLPRFAKTMRHDFLDRTFIYERRIWLPVVDGAQKLTIRIGEGYSRISIAGKQHAAGVDVKMIARHFSSRLPPKRPLKSRFAGAWLLMDRDTQADDNAEHLYRYIQKQHPLQNIHFVLREDSHDWARLKAEGFRLLAYGSPEHEAALHSCSKIISSHVDRYVVDYFKDNSLRDKHFIFLQHGVIKDDLSAWLNTKQRIDCFVTTAREEYLSIAGNDNRYKFTKKEVVLAGLPRHDALISAGKTSERLILIMPTWRNSLVGNTVGAGVQRELNPAFMSSLFAQSWSALLLNHRLRDLASHHRYRIVFFPHANIQPYLAQFQVPNHVEVMSHSEGSIQKLFKEASVMLTDYSSVAFEMATMEKPVIYFQFDETEVFSGEHTYSKGYFDYRRDGFGPVAINETALLDALEHLLIQDARPDAEYVERMRNFFAFRDGKNCERTYQSIVALDKPHDDGAFDADILFDYALSASKQKDWKLTESRWRQVIEKGLPQQQVAAQLPLTRVLRQQGKLIAAQALLKEQTDILGLPTNDPDQLHEAAELCMARYDWGSAERLLAHESMTSTYLLMRRLFCLAELGRQDQVKELVSTLFVEHVLTLAEQSEILALQAVAQSDWNAVITSLSENDALLQTHIEWLLLRARSYRKMKLFDAAHAELVRYEKYVRNNPACRIEIARLAFAQMRWEKVLSQLAQAYPEGLCAMPFIDAQMWVQAQRLGGRLTDAAISLATLEACFPDSAEIAVEKAELASSRKDWTTAVMLWQKLLHISDVAPYRLAEAYRKQGETEKGLAALLDTGVRSPQTVNEWILWAELATLNDDWSNAAWCWKSLLRLHSAEAPSYAWDRLQVTHLLARNAA